MDSRESEYIDMCVCTVGKNLFNDISNQLPISGVAMISAAMAACDDCRQCIVIDPICASYHSRNGNSKRFFRSECHMRCYNRCHGTREFNFFHVESHIRYNRFYGTCK